MPAHGIRRGVRLRTPWDLFVLGYCGHHHGPFGLGCSIVPINTGAPRNAVVVRGETRAVHSEYGWITAAITGPHDTLTLRRVPGEPALAALPGPRTADCRSRLQRAA